MGRSDKCHRESDPTSPCLRSSLINYLIWELALSAISQMPRTSTGNLDGGCHCVRWEALGPAAGGRRPRSRGAATKLRGESRRVERLRSKNKKPPQGRRGPKAMPGHCLRQQRRAGPLQLPPRPRGLPLVSGALWAVAPHCQRAWWPWCSLWLTGSLSLDHGLRRVARQAGSSVTQTPSSASPGSWVWNQGGIRPGGQVLNGHQKTWPRSLEAPG